MDIIQRLMDMRDEKYRDFVAPLIPNVSRDTIIGVRLPNVRALAKELVKSGEYREFISALPHKYFEEYLKCKVVVAENCEQCVAIGTGRAFELEGKLESGFRDVTPGLSKK